MAPTLGIIVDETEDCNKKKILMMYFDIWNYESKEWEHMFYKALDLGTDHTAKAIAKSIKHELDEIGVAVENVSGFGSDGANVMLGKKNGVAKLLQKHYPNLVEFHCANHRLSLAMDHFFSNIEAYPYMTDMISEIQMCLTFRKKKPLNEYCCE